MVLSRKTAVEGAKLLKMIKDEIEKYSRFKRACFRVVSSAADFNGGIREGKKDDCNA